MRQITQSLAGRVEEINPLYFSGDGKPIARNKCGLIDYMPPTIPACGRFGKAHSIIPTILEKL